MPARDGTAFNVSRKFLDSITDSSLEVQIIQHEPCQVTTCKLVVRDSVEDSSKRIEYSVLLRHTYLHSYNMLLSDTI